MKKFLFLTLNTLFLCVGCNAKENKTLTLEQKAAKLLIVGVKGTELTPNNPIVNSVVDLGVSGVIFFEHNLASPTHGVDSKARFGKFVADIQKLTPNKLFMTIDQEGGRVNRLKTKYGFEPMLSQKEIGATSGDSLAVATATTIAEEVKSVNLNVNFTPCVDVDVNPICPVVGKVDRPFSPDEKRVVELAQIYVEKHHKEGLLTSLKHFPGHGSSLLDSHNGFTDITATWSEKELVPYRELISKGLCDMVMVSHLFNSNIDPVYPATLSKLTLDSLLRGELKWDGVVVSDDMQMRAITDNYGFEEAIILALNAGVDLFIISSNIREEKFSVPEKFINTIVTGVKNGKIKVETLDKSVARVEKLRERL